MRAVSVSHPAPSEIRNGMRNLKKFRRLLALKLHDFLNHNISHGWQIGYHNFICNEWSGNGKVRVAPNFLFLSPYNSANFTFQSSSIQHFSTFI